MAFKLSKTTYETKPDDKLIVKDAYETSSSAVVNSYQDNSSDDLFAIDKIPGFSMGELLGKINGVLGKVNKEAGRIAGALGSGRLDGILGKGLPSLGSLGSLGGLGGAGLFGSIGGLLGKAGPLGSIGEIKKGIDQALASMGGISGAVRRVNDIFTSENGLERLAMGVLNDIMGGELHEVSRLAQSLFNKNPFDRRDDKKYDDFDTSTGSVDIKELTDQLTHGQSDLFSSIIDITDNKQSRIKGGMDNESLRDSVVIKIADTLTEIKSQEGSMNAQTITNIVNTLTDNNYDAVITNKGSTAALISAVTSMGAEMNMPHIFSKIAEKIEDQSILLKAAKPLVQRAIEHGDMRIIESMASTSIAKELKQIAPGVITSMVPVIDKPTGLAQQEYSKYYQGIKEAFNNIDPNWIKYERQSSKECINASQVGKNYFFMDLIRAQMNELMHPDQHLANRQSIYQESHYNDTSVSRALKAGQGVPDTGALANYDYTAAGDLIEPITRTIRIEQDGQIHILNFEDEIYLLLAMVFNEDSVDESLQRDFPQWYQSLEHTPILPCQY